MNKRKKGGGQLKLVSDHVETETFPFQWDDKPLDCFQPEKEVIFFKYHSRFRELTRGGKSKS